MSHEILIAVAKLVELRARCVSEDPSLERGASQDAIDEIVRFISSHAGGRPIFLMRSERGTSIIAKNAVWFVTHESRPEWGREFHDGVLYADLAEHRRSGVTAWQYDIELVDALLNASGPFLRRVTRALTERSVAA